MEYYADAYQQLAFVSAILGGLAFTAAAALLSRSVGAKDVTILNRSAKVTIGTAVLSSVCLIISAIMWSLMAADMSRAAASGSSFPTHVASKNWISSVIMILGSYLFFSSLGASGWISSKKLGIITTIAAVIGGIAMIVMMYWFADIS